MALLENSPPLKLCHNFVSVTDVLGSDSSRQVLEIGPVCLSFSEEMRAHY